MGFFLTSRRCAFRHLARFRRGFGAFFGVALGFAIATLGALRPTFTAATTAAATAAAAAFTFLSSFLTRFGTRAICFLFLNLRRDVFDFRRVIHAQRRRRGTWRHGFSGAQAFNAQRRAAQFLIRLEQHTHAKARFNFRKPVALAVQQP